VNIFWVISGQKLKKALVLIVAAFFSAGVIYAEKDSFHVLSKETAKQAEGPQAIYKVDTDAKRLSLTFDISWGNERTGPILDILKEKGVTNATFFVSSPWAEHHPDIVKRIEEMGFEIGSHGYKHIDYSRLKDDEIREQIIKADRILKSLIDSNPTLLRTPNGNFDKRVLRIADELGYTVIQWDTDSKDWLNPGADKIIENVVSKAHSGDIILLHASDSSKQTHEALPQIIDKLRKSGFEFVSVTQLISGIETKSKQLD
jgi:polysaccharide deacetylase family sporulation protein PdaB